jgi:hypothetical protein
MVWGLPESKGGMSLLIMTMKSRFLAEFDKMPKAYRTKSVPQEQQRFVERTVQDLNEHVQGCSAELVFNLVIVGIPDWEDRKTRKAVLLSRRRWRARRYILEDLEM